MKTDYIPDLVHSLEKLKKSVEESQSKKTWVQKWYPSESEENQRVHLETLEEEFKKLNNDARISKDLKKEFSGLLEECKVLDNESYTALKELEEKPGKTAAYGNELLKNITGKWEKDKENYNPKKFAPKTREYSILKDEDLFVWFPLLHARKHGSPRFVANLLSYIKRNLIGKRDPVNKGNTDTSSDVNVNSGIFYDVIIPQVLSAYVFDDDIDEAKEFLELTQEHCYHLYDDDDDQEHWPVRYIQYLGHLDKVKRSKGNYYCTRPPIPHSQTIKEFLDIYQSIYDFRYGRVPGKLILNLKLTQSDYWKQSGLLDKLQGYDGM
ncbi:hypothetical protein IWQ62_003790 [Dispira parvispora]|uniref:Uncharacterized protein n=1 Tax=Dispira parvispora TaxID=1520584 RepID=A0A9W8AR42_9FUNG|nr:hypothetical protein IWQ62_003790 [Dispira parvispora]